jgi:EAL domain-containing protein (putative c-di-GMP-specific phosphodiesterase class I)
MTYVEALYFKFKQSEKQLNTAFVRCFSKCEMEVMEKQFCFHMKRPLELLYQKGIMHPFYRLKTENWQNLGNLNKTMQTLINYQIPFILVIAVLINENLKTEFNRRLKMIQPYWITFQSFTQFIYLLPYEKGVQQELAVIAHEEWGQLGIALYPKDGVTGMDLMFKAKQNVNDQVHLKDKGLEAGSEAEIDQDNMIKNLIKEQNFIMHYQPIYDLKSKLVIGYEALFRSQAPLNNEQLFHAALKSDLIVSLDQCIIERVVSELEQIEFVSPIHFSINLSPKTFLRMNVFDYFKRLLNRHAIKASCIGIELTEQFYISDEKTINYQLKQLKDLGISIFLDDFGMGYSSLRDLAFLNFDLIKLDKRITQAIEPGNRVEHLVQSLLDYAIHTDCDIIFEGVETTHQLNIIESIGGRFIQGYLISKPLNLEQALKLLKKE